MIIFLSEILPFASSKVSICGQIYASLIHLSRRASKPSRRYLSFQKAMQGICRRGVSGEKGFDRKLRQSDVDGRPENCRHSDERENALFCGEMD